MASSTPNVNPTQLVRYVLQIDAMTDADSISRVRQQLTDMKLLVDRIGPGEVEIAVTHPDPPTSEQIREAIENLGFKVQNITSQTG